MLNPRAIHVNPDGASLIAARLDEVVTGLRTRGRVSMSYPDPYFYAVAVTYREGTVVFTREDPSG